MSNRIGCRAKRVSAEVLWSEALGVDQRNLSGGSEQRENVGNGGADRALSHQREVDVQRDLKFGSCHRIGVESDGAPGKLGRERGALRHDLCDPLEDLPCKQGGASENSKTARRHWRAPLINVSGRESGAVVNWQPVQISASTAAPNVHREAAFGRAHLDPTDRIDSDATCDDLLDYLPTQAPWIQADVYWQPPQGFNKDCRNVDVGGVRLETDHDPAPPQPLQKRLLRIRAYHFRKPQHPGVLKIHRFLPRRT